LLSFGKPPLVLSKLPIQAKTGASITDAFFLILAITLFSLQNFLLPRIIVNKRLFRIEII
jgi:hypothetical protein